jgi:small basic protein (TIGR04137 family)
MSVDRSLKGANLLTRHRNVLTRAERIEKLAAEERWREGDSVFGLEKVANRNLKVGKKTKKEKEGEAGGASPASPV